MSETSQSAADEAKSILRKLVESGMKPSQIFKELENHGVRLNAQFKYFCRSIYHESRPKR